MSRAAVRAVACCGLVVAAGCLGCTASTAGACANAGAQVFLEVGSEVCGRLCYTAICGEPPPDDNPPAHDEITDTSLAPPPPPEVVAERRARDGDDDAPGPGGCRIAVHDDDTTAVTCADGTRATFSTSALERVPALSMEGPALAADPCRGGRVVTSGLDRDGNGMLSPDEVTGRVVLCGGPDQVPEPTLDGIAAVHGPRDVAALAQRRALTGDLVVECPALLRLALPSLVSVGGSVVVKGSPALTALRLPGLWQIGRQVEIVDAAGLDRGELDPALQRALQHGGGG